MNWMPRVLSFCQSLDVIRIVKLEVECVMASCHVRLITGYATACTSGILVASSKPHQPCHFSAMYYQAHASTRTLPQRLATDMILKY